MRKPGTVDLWYIRTMFNGDPCSYKQALFRATASAAAKRLVDIFRKEMMTHEIEWVCRDDDARHYLPSWIKESAGIIARGRKESPLQVPANS